MDEEPRSPGGGRPSRSAGGFHMYNISEMVTVMGKKKKMPMTLGINLGTGTIMLAPERAQDGPTQEWTADRMTHYSREGKHVFLELVRPSKSVDFHAGAKDTAEEIVAALGELAGAVRVTSLKEEFRPGGQKRGQMLYDFMAQGDDEVTVAVGDDVIILDDTLSDEWWKVRRLKNGKEGVVPSSYVEVTSTGAGGSGSTSPTAPPVPSSSKSIVEQNRAEEIRLTKEALRASRDQQSSGSAEVGPGVRLPERGSSLSGRDAGVAASGSQRTKAVRSDNAGGGPQRSSKSSKLSICRCMLLRRVEMANVRNLQSPTRQRFARGRIAQSHSAWRHSSLASRITRSTCTRLTESRLPCLWRKCPSRTSTTSAR